MIVLRANDGESGIYLTLRLCYSDMSSHIAACECLVDENLVLDLSFATCQVKVSNSFPLSSPKRDGEK